MGKGTIVMLGCSRCRFARGGCLSCREGGPYHGVMSSRKAGLTSVPSDGVVHEGLTDAPVFRPSEKEFFNDPNLYIDSIRSKAGAAGFALVIPPTGEQSGESDCSGWEPLFAHDTTGTAKTTETLYIKPVQQTLSQFFRRSGEAIPTREHPRNFNLKALARYDEWFTKEHFETERPSPMDDGFLNEIEAEVWRVVERPRPEDSHVQPLYVPKLSATTHGSGFPATDDKLVTSTRAARGRLHGPGQRKWDVMTRQSWNLTNVNATAYSLYPALLKDSPNCESNVCDTHFDVGTCLAVEGWRVEELYKISYLHVGHPRVHYCLSVADAEAGKNAIQEELRGVDIQDAASLWNGSSLTPLSSITRRGIRVYRCVQREGQFVVTFPNAIHCSLNTGFNFVESVPACPYQWLDSGLSSQSPSATPSAAPLSQLQVKTAMAILSAQSAPNGLLERALAIVERWYAHEEGTVQAICGRLPKLLMRRLQGSTHQKQARYISLKRKPRRSPSPACSTSPSSATCCKCELPLHMSFVYKLSEPTNVFCTNCSCVFKLFDDKCDDVVWVSRYTLKQVMELMKQAEQTIQRGNRLQL